MEQREEVGKFQGECGDTWATHCKALFVLVLLLVEVTTGVLLPLRHFTHWGGTEISAFKPSFFFLSFFFPFFGGLAKSAPVQAFQSTTSREPPKARRTLAASEWAP